MATQALPLARPEGLISEWRPTRATLVVWSILAFPACGVAAIGYLSIAFRDAHGWEVDLSLLTVALWLGLGWVHEAIHGVAMLAFGARPQCGVLRIGGVVAGFYTTAPGRRFSRAQYVLIALAPVAILTPLGAAACLVPFGTSLAIPFALVFAGAIGDATIAWRVIRAPSGVMCEDLRDGTRFWTAGS
jgi:Putative zincin peptidase